MAELSPMMRQYMEIKEQNKDSIIFYRLGDFYEMFFDDAIKGSEELELTLTGRDCGLDERAPMCGVPYHSCESYISRLVEKGYKVAICEQIEDPATAKGIVKRDIVRIITPGTVIEGEMLDESRNNYLAAAFCQNSKIADCTIAKEISVRRLSEIFLELQNKGAYNINLVTPTHYAGHIINALYLAKAAGLSIPVVYNTSGYEKVETLKLLDGLVDVYLPDMKYLDEKIALKYSKAADYPKIAMQAIEEMFRQAGNPVFDEKNGIMKKGMIVRHLVLPGNTEDSKKVIKYLYEKYGNNIYLSIMSQYTPMKAFLEDEKYKAIYPELGRKLSGREYDEVVDYAIELGVENAFIQEGDTADESFIPEFDYLGL